MAKKVGIYGGIGDEFDDGVYDSVRKVCVGVDGDRVSSVEFEYGKGDQTITLSHGKKSSEERKEFVLGHARGEYIKSVEGTYDEYFISSLMFITSVERDREVFGKAVGTKFVLKAKGFDKLVGFRGRSYLGRLNALGAHFAVVLAPPVKKLEAKGGNFGDVWDDGVHDNVRKIKVRRCEESVEMVKFKYVNGTEIVSGDAHGDTSQLPFVKEKFVLSGDEYITSVHGHYGQKIPVGQSFNLHARYCNGITMLKFKTNKDTYQVLGAETEGYEYVGTSFVLGETGHKIVGFHGKSSTFSLAQIGVYVSPINNA
ncbi:Jacalin-like lectin domain [Arabidopsis suecica]|uniref:Jacalin-like lectin domain n=1 Tax=Arabidopsis suecica TaxID=45249 RepID=A0A8T1YKE7_ARASU|nr:Jacalin-like lectin domain [Arabidopsis suecica]